MPYNKNFEIKSYPLNLGKKIAQTRYSITLSIAVLLTVLALALPALAQAVQASTPGPSAPKTQLNHGSSGQPLVSILSVASGQKYQVVEDGLTSGAMVYIDRSYTFTSVPSSILLATYIKTANNDKNRTQQNFLTMSVDQDVTVYVAYDRRATALPNWLSGWTNTGERLGTTDVGRNLFSRDSLLAPLSWGQHGRWGCGCCQQLQRRGGGAGF